MVLIDVENTVQIITVVISSTKYLVKLNTVKER